jgi:hypothetical protein
MTEPGKSLEPAAAPDPADEIVDAEIVEDPTPPRPDLTLPPAPAFDYTDAGVPTLDYVRGKVEQRLGTADGAVELAGGADSAKAQADRDAERERLAQEKLEAIRRSLRGDG